MNSLIYVLKKLLKLGMDEWIRNIRTWILGTDLRSHTYVLPYCWKAELSDCCVPRRQRAAEALSEERSSDGLMRRRRRTDERRTGKVRYSDWFVSHVRVRRAAVTCVPTLRYALPGDLMGRAHLVFFLSYFFPCLFFAGLYYMCTTSWAPLRPGPWAVAPLPMPQGRPWSQHRPE